MKSWELRKGWASLLKQRADQKVVRFLQIPFTQQQTSAQENGMSFLE